jgi:3'-phosphoadenosine 5'-phosphosulfate sulfotransferase (PAPS reductase)/FAD synthetase
LGWDERVEERKVSRIDLEELRYKQSLPLDLKEKLSEERIRDWYEHWDGKVYISFSGGKDSTVLLDMVRRIYPEVPAVFVNTGLEYPEILEFVETINNVIWVRPKLTFRQVLEKHGYPVVSKTQARFISDLQNAKGQNEATVNLRLTGMNRKGVYCPSMKLSKKWLPLVDSGFKISSRCCDVIKKEPLYRYEKESGKKAYCGMMAYESTMRERNYLRDGCNVFTRKTTAPISMPIAFWLEEDIWEYIRKHDIPYSKIYDMGEKRTGCMFCMFGVHLEKGENRFQRMKKSHPKQYKYCMEKLGLREVLDFIGMEYE